MGQFIWYDVMTTDVQAALAFYQYVMGWTASFSGLEDRTYMVFSIGDSPIGGLMPIPEPLKLRGAQPSWFGYVFVNDVDDYAERITLAGGSVFREPQDIPEVGRFAVVGDPEGAVFVLFAPSDPEVDPRRVPPGTPGHVGWHELHIKDNEKTFGFYQELFGWQKGAVVDMGAMGVYQEFTTDGDMPVGGMTKMPDDSPVPSHWLYYFNVDSIDAAGMRVILQSGKVTNGPHEMPDGEWIVHCEDPLGAAFGMTGPL